MEYRYKQWVKDVQRVRGETENRHGILRLEKNERITPFPDSFWRETLGRFSQEYALAYPEPERFYHTLSSFHGLSPDHFVLTAGSDSAIRNGFDLCVKPGDAVVTLDPTFAMVDVYCKLYAAEKRGIGYTSSLILDIEKLMTAIDDKTSLAVIANPNSPTGTLIPIDAMEAVIAHAERKGTVVLVDEAYYGFGSPTCADLVRKYSNLMVTRTFSKACGLAGLRIGYIIAQPKLAGLLYRFRPMYEVNSVSLLFAQAVLEHYEIVERYCQDSLEGKKFFLDALTRMGIRYVDCHTNFVHVDFGGKKAAALASFDKENIRVRGGLAISGFENFLRVTYGPAEPMERLVAVMDALWA